MVSENRYRYTPVTAAVANLIFYMPFFITQALWKRKLLEEEIKPVIRIDNGPQFKSRIFQEKGKYGVLEQYKSILDANPRLLRWEE
ncbi:hypothetical protein JCM39194_02320 [Desulfotomaculum varum]